MHAEELEHLLHSLVGFRREREWVEFKENNEDPQDIGEYISAIANSATLHGQRSGFIVWGIKDGTCDLVGTAFRPKEKKIKNQELENWLATQLSPPVNFKIHEHEMNDQHFVLIEVPAASYTPVRFKDFDYIRVGTYKKKLKDHPEKERELWTLLSKTSFEKGIAKRAVSADQVLSLIDYPSYFELTKQPLPDNREGILNRLEDEQLIAKERDGTFNITNLGAVLFAKNIENFEGLSRKAVRVILYKGTSRVETIQEQVGRRGYAAGFEGLVGYVNTLLPKNELIGEALRKEVRMYPEIAIRELVANALIHQDFMLTGTGPTVEIFSDRVEITNPGIPLIDTRRFLDAPPQSRNETLAALMRRVNVCEERGSGIDKVILNVEIFQLPAPDFVVTERHTKATLFAYKTLADMDRNARIRACYQHACLRYVSNEKMTNTSLRQRFDIDDKNYAIASRIIADTIEENLIKRSDPESTSKKHAKYVPFWA
ncbi:MAG: RNA-binding domain-containing protein [Candidatus Binatia bacterium]